MNNNIPVYGVSQRKYTGGLLPVMNNAPEKTMARRANVLISKTLESQIRSSGELKNASLPHNSSCKNNFDLIRYSEHPEDSATDRSKGINDYKEWSKDTLLCNSLLNNPLRTKSGEIVVDESLLINAYSNKRFKFFKSFNTVETGRMTSCLEVDDIIKNKIYLDLNKPTSNMAIVYAFDVNDLAGFLIQITFDKDSKINHRIQATEKVAKYLHNNIKSYKDKSIEKIKRDLIVFIVVEHCDSNNYTPILNLIQAMVLYRENNSLHCAWRKPNNPSNDYDKLVSATGLNNQQIKELVLSINAIELYINSIIGLFNNKIKREESNQIKRLEKIKDLFTLYGKDFDYEKIDILGDQIQALFMKKIGKGFIDCDWI